jgi:hypothetical protein
MPYKKKKKVEITFLTNKSNNVPVFVDVTRELNSKTRAVSKSPKKKKERKKIQWLKKKLIL